MTNFDATIDIPASTGMTPSAAEVVEEGQFQYAYFPNCTSAGQMNTLIGVWITAASSRVEREVGASNWASTDAKIISMIHDAILYMVCARAWNVVRGVMIAYDAEALPPEYVDPDACADQRDFYLSQARELLASFDQTPAASNFVGLFRANGVEDDDEDITSILGLQY